MRCTGVVLIARLAASCIVSPWVGQCHSKTSMCAPDLQINKVFQGSPKDNTVTTRAGVMQYRRVRTARPAPTHLATTYGSCAQDVQVNICSR